VPEEPKLVRYVEIIVHKHELHGVPKPQDEAAKDIRAVQLAAGPQIEEWRKFMCRSLAAARTRFTGG